MIHAQGNIIRFVKKTVKIFRILALGVSLIHHINIILCFSTCSAKSINIISTFSYNYTFDTYDVNVNDVVVSDVTLGTVTGEQCWDRSVAETEAV